MNRDTANGPLRVAFLTVMPSPYTQDLFHALAADGRIEPRVFYMEMEAPDTGWGAAALPDYARLLPGRWFWFLGGRLHANPSVLGQLRAARPNLVVVAGYAGLTSQAAMCWLRARRIPWVFWGELPAMNRRGPLGAALRWLAQRPALRWPDAIAAIGSRAAEAYRRLAPAGCLVHNIPYHCDLQAFLSIPRPSGASPILTRRASEGLEISDLATLTRRASEDRDIPSEVLGLGSSVFAKSADRDIPARRASEEDVVHSLRECVPSENRQIPARSASESGVAADPRPLRLLYCGQLIERKGVDLLLRAFEQLAGEFPALELTLVGQGPLGERLAAGLPDHVRGRVTFAGFQPVAELPRYFAAADAFVLPSRHDGWGVVVNQAMAAGLPVICSDAVGAACDLVAHGENGLVCAAGDADALAGAIRSLAERPELLGRMGARSREKAFDWTPDRGAARWHALCREVLARRAGVDRNLRK